MITEKEIHDRLWEALGYITKDNELEVDYLLTDECTYIDEDGWYAGQYSEPYGVVTLIDSMIHKPIATDTELHESGLDIYEVFRNAPFEFYIDG